MLNSGRSIPTFFNMTMKKQKNKLSFTYHLADHCNLRCKGCDNYSSIAPERLQCPNEFSADIKRIGELFGNNIDTVWLMGGEPLLNPRVCEFMIAARSVFPNLEIRIHLVSNGILFMSMEEEFWKTARENDITISYTPYPIDYPKDMEKMIFDRYGVSLGHLMHKNDTIKRLQFLPFDLHGNQNADENFAECFHAGKCIQLRGGKLFTCNVRAYADFFADKYDVQLDLSQKDYIDIYKTDSAEEILAFLYKPIPFCRYCDIKHRRYNHIWRTDYRFDSVYDWSLFGFDDRGIDYLNNFRTVWLISENTQRFSETEKRAFQFNLRVMGYSEFMNGVSESSAPDAALLCFEDEELLYSAEEKLIEVRCRRILYIT